jgi:hypothetical protein
MPGFSEPSPVFAPPLALRREYLSPAQKGSESCAKSASGATRTGLSWVDRRSPRSIFNSHASVLTSDGWPVTIAASKNLGREDELPFGREADRGIFVEAGHIVVRGTDEWEAEASDAGPNVPVAGTEDHRHHYVLSVLRETSRNAERLGAEGNDALNVEAARADSAVAATIASQQNLKKAHATNEAAERATQKADKSLHDLEASTGLSSGVGELIAQGVPLAVGFMLEAVLLWLAFQKVEFGANWIRLVIVVLLGAFMTFIAHSLASWITADWDREPKRRRLHLGVAGVYAVCIGGVLVGLAYIRSQDIVVAGRSLSNPGLFSWAILIVLFLVSVMGSIFAGYAGYRHGRSAPLRHARRTLMAARKDLKVAGARLKAAESDERRTSAAEESSRGALDSLVETFTRALTQVPSLAIEIANRCLRAENRNFTVEREYRKELGAVQERVAALGAALAERHTEILNELDKRRVESKAQHA